MVPQFLLITEIGGPDSIFDSLTTRVRDSFTVMNTGVGSLTVRGSPGLVTSGTTSETMSDRPEFVCLFISDV